MPTVRQASAISTKGSPFGVVPNAPVVGVVVVGVVVAAAKTQLVGGGVITLSSRVTAPVRAMARPSMMLAPVLSVTLASAMMLPAKTVVVPSVAELPTCQ
jgi:hypothetical protein